MKPFLKKMMRYAVVGGVGSLIAVDLTGCCCPQQPVVAPKPVVKPKAAAVLPANVPNNPILKVSPVIVLRAIGEGVAPINAISPAQARALARRAAIDDAYRALGEKMYGVRLTARDTVKDMVMKHSEVRAEVYALIRGAQIDEESFKDGLYRVSMEVKLDTRIWRRYLDLVQ